MNSLKFKNWIISEIKTPSIEPKFFSQSIQRLKEFERRLRPSWNIIKKAIEIESDIRGRRKIYDLWNSIPLEKVNFFKKDYIEKPYSDEIQDLVDYSSIKSVDFTNITRHIRNIVEYYGIRKGWQSDFRNNYTDVMGKEYSDGTGGNYIDNIIDEIKGDEEYGYAVEIMKKTKDIFQNIMKYVSEVSKVEEHLKALYDLRQRQAEKFFSGNAKRGDILPQTKDVEILYHATPFLKEIQISGLKVGDRKALGGDTSGGISFTANFAIAKEIARNFREVMAIAKGQKTPEQIILLAKSKGVDLTNTSPYKEYMYQKQLDSMNIPRKSGIYHQDQYYALELFRHYVALSHDRYDPLFFGINFKDFEDLDPRNVGVIAAKVNMSKVIEYLSAMEEYRIPPEAVLSFKVIPV